MRGEPQFHLLGVPVRVEVWFLIIAFLAGIGIGFDGTELIVWVLLVPFAVLVHEIGHAIALRLMGQRPSIHLTWFAGLTYPSGAVTSRAKRVTALLAGPVMSIVVLGLPAMTLRDSGELEIGTLAYTTTAMLVVMSFGYGVLNLLPILPLDGGYIFEDFIGRRRTLIVSVIAAIAATVYIFDNYFDLYVYLIVAVICVVELVRMNRGDPPLELIPESPFAGGGGLQASGSRGGPSKRRKGFGRKRSHLQAVPDARDYSGHLTAARETEVRPPGADQVEALAWEGLRRNDVAAARRALSRHPSPELANPFLVASLALAEGRHDEAVEFFAQAYLADPNGPSSLVPATLLGQNGVAAALAERLLTTDGRNAATAAANLQSHLHYAKAYAAAAVVGELVYADGRYSAAQAAFEAACSHAQAGDPVAGLEWVRRAIDAGFTAGGLLDSESDLTPVRALPQWGEIRSRLP